MPLATQVNHRSIRSLAIPYESYRSPTATDSNFSPGTRVFVPGSKDLMTSAKGYAERRYGFSDAVESTPTTFNNLQRLFTWDRFDGTFIEMACDINSSGFAQVFKRVIGADNSFVSIFADTTSTPFDFIVSNNTVYFSNGNVAKKWTPTAGLTNWGIAIGSVNNATGPNTAGAGADGGGGGPVWTNPGNVSSAVSFATANANGLQTTNPLKGTSFGFSLPGTNTVSGIQVSLVAGVSNTTNVLPITVQLLQGGNPAGTSKTQNVTGGAGTSTFTFGSSSDLWGTTWKVNDVNQTTFGFQLTAKGSGTSGSPAQWSANDFQVTVFGLGGPSISVSGSAGSFSAAIGYQYVFCYGNSNSGHISSPTPPSASTGAFSNKLNVQVSLTASTDTQVDQVRVFRSTDSVAAGTNAGTYLEIPNSPFSNTTQNITDNAADTSLSISSVAPIPTFNDPPTPFKGMAYFSGRVWGFKNNQVFFSGLEEITSGVPEESFPSGVAGNFWSFDQPVQGLQVVGSEAANSQALVIFCGGRIYAISGSTLDTFRRFTIDNRHGTRNLTCLTSLSGMVAWLDSANQIWITDGSNVNEVGMPIRNDLKNVVPANCSMTFHKSGDATWLVFSTGTQLFVFDMATSMWMPPWSFACNYLFSGETAPGSYVLMAATSNKALQLNQSGTPGKYNDNGATYLPIARLCLQPLIPDYGTRYSLYSDGTSDAPSRTGYATAFQVDTNANGLSNVSVAVDDDPTLATTVYSSISSNLVSVPQAYLRNQGRNIIQTVFKMNKEAEGRWASFQIVGQNADDNLALFGAFYAYKPIGGM